MADPALFIHEGTLHLSVLFVVCRIWDLQGVFCTAQGCFIAGEMGWSPNLQKRLKKCEWIMMIVGGSHVVSMVTFRLWPRYDLAWPQTHGNRRVCYWSSSRIDIILLTVSWPDKSPNPSLPHHRWPSHFLFQCQYSGWVENMKEAAGSRSTGLETLHMQTLHRVCWMSTSTLFQM